jgi:hypothetical protein
MENIKKYLAYLLVTLFVLSAVFALIAFNFERKAFQAETYQEVLATQDFYNRIPAVMAEAMVSSPTNFQSLPLTMQGMTTSAWEDFFRTLLPQDALKSIGDDTLNATFAYLNMDSDSITISFAPIKTNMATDGGVQAVLTLFRTQPACTFEQVAEITINLFMGGQIEFCNPPDELVPLLIPVIKAELQAATLIIPNEVKLVNTVRGKEDPRNRIQTGRTLMKLSPLLPIGFLFLLTITVVNSLKSWLAWWGIPFATTGVIAMSTSLLGGPILGVILKQLIQWQTRISLPISLSDYAGEISSAILGAILRPIFWEGLFLFFAGMGMIIFWLFVEPKTLLKIKNLVLI